MMATAAFKEFCLGTEFGDTLQNFTKLCCLLNIDNESISSSADVYNKLKENLHSRDAINLFHSLDTRRSKTEYWINKENACKNKTVRSYFRL